MSGSAAIRVKLSFEKKSRRKIFIVLSTKRATKETNKCAFSFQIRLVTFNLYVTIPFHFMTGHIITQQFHLVQRTQ